jgi:chorismate-pyruvate lyase
MNPGDGLVELHFMRQEAAPEALREVEIAALEPFLRGLVFADGTVTRALEVQTLSCVTVDVVDQSPTVVPADAAHHLDVEQGADCLRRRVTIRLGGTTPTMCAESYIIPQRLPGDFLGRLRRAPGGIGDSVQQLNLESRRELLWFRLGRAPAWAPAACHPMTALIRLYRLITAGRPALLIAEFFAVERHSGLYRLVGPACPPLSPTAHVEAAASARHEP